MEKHFQKWQPKWFSACRGLYFASKGEKKSFRAGVQTRARGYAQLMQLDAAWLPKPGVVLSKIQCVDFSHVDKPTLLPQALTKR